MKVSVDPEPAPIEGKELNKKFCHTITSSETNLASPRNERLDDGKEADTS